MLTLGPSQALTLGEVLRYIQPREGKNDLYFLHERDMAGEFFALSPISYCQFTKTHLVGEPVTHHVKMGRTVSLEVGGFTHCSHARLRTQGEVTWLSCRLSTLNLIERF